MATAATSLLGLALPVTGELSGTWGDTVNVSITALLDSAVAGTTTLSSDADVTLTTTTLAANQARQAIILWTAGGTATRTITVPAQSKAYIVINKTSSSQSIKIVGAGPTTGVTIVAGTAAFVVWNGVDFVTASVTSTTGILPVANGGTGLSSGTSGGVLAYTATGTLASSAALAASALVIGGGAGAAPSTTTTGTGVVTALGVNVGTAGAFVVNGGALGSPSSVGTMPAFTLGGTVSGGGNQINNVIIGTTTPLAGAFTTLSATTPIATTSGGTGLSSFTSGGVMFASSSSVLATGSALTFDGTNFATTGKINVGSPSSTLSRLNVKSADTYLADFVGSDGALGLFLFNDSSIPSIGSRGGDQGLNINATGSTSAARIAFTAGSSEGMRLTSTALALQVGISLTGGTSGTGYSFSGSAPANSLTLDSSGNLGIGTTSPGEKLDVVGTARALRNTGATNTGDQNAVVVGATTTGAYAASYGAGLQFQITNSSGGYSGSRIVSRLNADNNTANLIFQARNYGFSDSMTLDSSGNLLVGTTVNPPGTRSLGFAANAGGNGIDIYQISNQSDWAINSTSGTIVNFYSDNGTALVAAGSITVNGGAALYNVTSDYRLKTVVGAVTGAGQRIDALKPIDYLWKEGNLPARGFLAHQFQEVYPSSVTGAKDAVDANGKPKYQSMQASTSEVIADLVAELQSLRARVAQLESKP